MQEPFRCFEANMRRNHLVGADKDWSRATLERLMCTMANRNDRKDGDRVQLRFSGSDILVIDVYFASSLIGVSKFSDRVVDVLQAFGPGISIRSTTEELLRSISESQQW